MSGDVWLGEWVTIFAPEGRKFVARGVSPWLQTRLIIRALEGRQTRLIRLSVATAGALIRLSQVQGLTPLATRLSPLRG